MTSELRTACQSLIDLAIAEDLGELGDITTKALEHPNRQGKAQILFKENGIICGLEILDFVFFRFHNNIHSKTTQKDGDCLNAGDVVIDIYGPIASILSAERIVLNFLGRLSGIATLTHHFVQAVRDTGTTILDTRKTTPGWRILEKYAVRCGGGENHRHGLWDMFLIKENHIAAAGGIDNAVQQCRTFMAENQIKCPIEVEAQTLSDVELALSVHVDRIMLDNMSLQQMRTSKSIVGNQIPLEASGNVSLDNVKAIAETGVDYISIGSLTHSANAVDVTLLFC